MRLDKKTIIVLLSLTITLPSFAAERLSTDELIQNLKNTDPKVREEAAKEVGIRGEKLALEGLDQATLDKDPEVQLAVVDALGKIHHPQQVSYLSRAVRNTRGKAQEKAISLLTEVYIPSHEHGKFKKLWTTIAKLFDPPDVTIVEPWQQVDQEAIDAITFVLDQKDSENRIEAAASLGLLRARASVPRLAFYLRSPNTRMVRTTVRSLGYIGDPAAGPYLIPMLKHSDDDVVTDTARVLGQLHYREALPELQKLFEYSDDDDYRRAAFAAISRIADPSFESWMVKYLDSDDKALQIAAIEGIGRMNLRQHVQRLQLHFQREKSRTVKMALSFSLYALGEPAYIDTLVLNLKERDFEQRAESYLVELGPRAVTGVAAYLKGADKDFKVLLIDLLGNMHQPSAIAYIEPYLKHDELDVARAATNAVGKLRRIQNVTG
jgi:HEAT repeat protein